MAHIAAIAFLPVIPKSLAAFTIKDILDLTEELDNKATARLVHPGVAVKVSSLPPLPSDFFFFLIISFAFFLHVMNLSFAAGFYIFRK
jgi:hypothetical protein